MNNKLKQTRQRFIFLTGLLAIISTSVLGLVLYEANIIRFSDQFVSKDLQAAVENHPEVKEYLETEHQNEAHFITIANIIQNNQQRELGRILVIATAITVVAAVMLAYFIAKRLMMPVEEAYEAQERFIGDAAHELRNPLATMSVVIQNATNTKKPATPTETQKYFKQIQRQLGRMVRINEDLLYLERNIDNDSNEPSNISELLLDVLEDLQPSAHDAKLRFKSDITENIMASISPRDFVKLSKNLIENAIKYSRPNSKVVAISLKQQKGKITIMVKDNGIGIPASDLHHISERFFRASNVEKIIGSGLGLAIVQKVVKNNGGRFTITSVEGKGTTVRVEL